MADIINLSDPKDKRILIVEDDESVMDFLRFALEKEGFRTTSAADGEEAIKKANNEKPDLILLDMMLPKKGGFEVIKAIQTSECRHIPVIVITGRFIDDSFRDMVKFEPNVKEFILKPVKTPYLVFRLHSILQTKSKEEAAAEQRRKTVEERLRPKAEE
ncbi:MAG: response regulator [Elusimicrobiota bacterium]